MTTVNRRREVVTISNGHPRRQLRLPETMEQARSLRDEKITAISRIDRDIEKRKASDNIDVDPQWIASAMDARAHLTKELNRVLDWIADHGGATATALPRGVEPDPGTSGFAERAYAVLYRIHALESGDIGMDGLMLLRDMEAAGIGE